MNSKLLPLLFLTLMIVGCSKQPVQTVKREVTQKVEQLNEQQAYDRYRELTDKAREQGKKFRLAQERCQWDQVKLHATARAEYLREALELVTPIPKRVDVRIDLTMELAEAEFENGKPEEAERLYQSVLKLTSRLEAHRMARKSLFRLYQRFGQNEKALAVINKAIDVETDVMWKCAMIRSLAGSQVWDGQLDSGERLAERGLKELEGQTDERATELRADFFEILGRAAQERGNESKARDYRQKALEAKKSGL